MRKLIVVMSICAFSVSLEAQLEVVESSFPEQLKTQTQWDSIWYHSYYADNAYAIFPDYQQDPWVFVRFTPTAQHIAEEWKFAGARWWFHHYLAISSPEPGTLAVWAGDISPANLKLLVAFWEPQSGNSLKILEDNGRYFVVTGDFWVGYCGLHYPGGDSIMPCTDITSSTVSNRNYYSFNGKYGSRTLYGDYDFLITAFLKKEPAGTEENSLPNTVYLNPKSNLILKNEGITFTYKISKSSFLKLYGIDGRLMDSKLLNAGEGKVVWKSNLSSGIYFYKLFTGKENFSGKLLIL